MSWVRQVLFLSIVIFVSALDMTAQDVQSIYLKDGSIIKGEILENSDYLVRVIITSNDTLTIGYKHILSVGQVFNTYSHRAKSMRKEKTHLNSGAFIGLSTGVTLHTDSESGFQAGLNFGKRLGDKVYLGGSIDYNTYVKSFQFIYLSHKFASLSAYGRYYFLNKKSKYYAAARLGYSNAINDQFNRDFNESYFDEYEGGLTSELSIGVHFPSSEKFRFLAEFSISHQQTNGMYGALDWSTNLPVRASYDINYVRPGITIGIEF